MSPLPFWQPGVSIGLCARATLQDGALTLSGVEPARAPRGHIRYLGKALPSAVFALLVVYCLKDVSLLSGDHSIPEAIALLVTTLLHL